MARWEELGSRLRKMLGGAGSRTSAAETQGIAVAGDAKDNVFVTGGIHLGGDPPPPSRCPQLPADIADFAGRERQVNELLALLGPAGGKAAISAIDGMGGLGKTT